MGIQGQSLQDLAECALLHDNAVAQYIQEELQNDSLRNGVMKLGRHCTIGEKFWKIYRFIMMYLMSYCTPHENADGSEPFGKQWNEKKLLRNKRSSRSEQNGKKKQGIIWPKKKSCKMTDFSLLPVIPPEVHRMVSPGRKWVWNLGKIWKKMSDLLVYSYLSLVTETGSLFVGSKSELISGALSSAVKFCWMISSVFCFFCNSCFSRRVAAC